jgi:hypothetical protein
MDIIHQCLSLAPVPYLVPAFDVLRFIWTCVEQAQASKQQLHALAQTIAQLLSTLNQEYCAGRLVRARTSTPVADLDKFVMYTVPNTFGFYTSSSTDCSRISQHLFRRRPRANSWCSFSPKIGGLPRLSNTTGVLALQ